jgi:hypothetical protein
LHRNAATEETDRLMRRFRRLLTPDHVNGLHEPAQLVMRRGERNRQRASTNRSTLPCRGRSVRGPLDAGGEGPDRRRGRCGTRRSGCSAACSFRQRAKASRNGLGLDEGKSVVAVAPELDLTASALSFCVRLDSLPAAPGRRTVILPSSRGQRARSTVTPLLTPALTPSTTRDVSQVPNVDGRNANRINEKAAVSETHRIARCCTAGVTSGVTHEGGATPCFGRQGDPGPWTQEVAPPSCVPVP